MRIPGYYPDFGTGIIIGLLLGTFVSAVLCAVLYSRVRRLTDLVDSQNLIVAAYAAHTPRESHEHAYARTM